MNNPNNKWIQQSDEVYPASDEAFYSVNQYKKPEIDVAHRWIKYTNNYYGKVDEEPNIIKFVEFNEESHPDQIGWTYPWARFANHWAVTKWNGGATNPDYVRIVHECFPINGLKTNITLYPVFKPWAECDFTMFKECPPGKGEPFSKTSISFLKRILEKHYCNPFGDSFRQHWYVDARQETHKSWSVISRYLKTISPFKNEFWFLHGARKEYSLDRINDKYNGYSALAFENVIFEGGLDGCIKNDLFRKLHDIHMKWNPTSSLGLWFASCYSGGMQSEPTRPVLHNCLISDTSKILPGVSDICCICGATAQHTSVGNLRDGFFSDMLVRTIYTNSSLRDYLSLTIGFNNRINNLVCQVFAVLREFFNKNFNLMMDILRPELEQQWLDTKQQIQDDLNNNGEKYFRYELDLDEIDDSTDLYFYPE